MTKLMQTIFTLFFALLFSGCSNEKTTEKTESASAGNGQETAVVTENSQESESAASQGGITGDWKLDWEVFDDNGNWKMEPEEKAKAYRNNYRLLLRTDGSSRIQNMFNGRYEIKEENGRQMLYVYRERVVGEEDEDPLPEVFHIYSKKADELILQVVSAGEPSSFWIFKRA